MADAVSVFISYFHEDMEFVDRLDADLQARGFVTWVDRRRLEGTAEWPPQIDSAIDSFPMMIVVLSQGALDSEYVRYEYERGHELGKRIVTVRYREFYVQLPPELSKIQYVDFMDKSGESYERTLRVLIVGCQNPHPHQSDNPRLLYEQAHDLERIDTERERAASLYQRLLINNPQYAGGEAQRDLERLNQQLYPQRAQILREKAEAAHKAGQYSEEVGALKALIDLGDQDRTMLEWAREYLRVAEENSEQMDLYDFIQKRASRASADDLADARSKLEILWTKARFFRDPAGVAPVLGVKVPIGYEQWKEERLADAAKAKREQEAAAERDALIVQAQASARAAVEEENALWQAAKDIIAKKSDYISENQLTGWGSASDNLLRSLVWRQRLTERVSLILEAVQMILAIATFVAVFVVGGMFGISLVSAVNNAIGKDWFLFVLVVVLVIFLGLLYAAWGAAYGVWIGLGVVSEWGSKRTRTLQQNSMSNQKQRWEALAEAEHRRRLSSIEREQQRLSDEAELQYQAQLPGIDAEHAKTLADIEARYPD